ncbi:hypothetical protein ACFL5D_02185 [Candidatus Neomarinimicrobiota bacterium]
MQNKIPLYKRDLVSATGAPPYTIDYLYRCNRLPTIKESSGSGYPIVFHPDCIEIIKEHLQK